MRDSNHPERFKDPVAEARRYVQNAKDILQKKGKFNSELQLYEDRKYVKMAGNTLWNGVLLILDAVFHITENKKNRPNFVDYQRAVAPRDQKLLALVLLGYDQMHLAMGYDGNPSKATCQDGIRVATDIIDRCAGMLVK